MRLLLDTNVWTYLHAQDALRQLHRTARASGTTVLISPAVVFEQLRVKDSVRRRQLVEVTTRGTWERMRPEAWVVADEVVEALKSQRPDWILDRPNAGVMHNRRQNELDWTRGGDGFWSRARRSPNWQSSLNETSSAVSDSELNEAVLSLKNSVSKAGATPDTLDLGAPHIKFTTAYFSDGTTLEMQRWAFDAAMFLDRQLHGPSSTFRDWLDPFFDSRRTRNQIEWLRLWGEVDPSDAPTLWLGWAASITTAAGAVNPGTPVDSQLVTYLNRADVFATADRRLVNVINKLRQYAPVPIARPVRVAAATAGAEVLQLAAQSVSATEA